MYHAIEKVGCGKRTHYIIKKVINKATIPVDCKRYRTEQAARKAAEAMGLVIAKCGDCYEII